MYDYIKGTIEEITPTEMTLECAGIGYRIAISLNSYDKFSAMKETKVYIYHHLREDEETLYGFCEKEERRLFTLLISVSGIGPGTARVMLSTLTADELSAAIISGDVNRIKSVKGIGLKTAQKAIIELKDKISKKTGGELDLSSPASAGTASSEAVSALITLGFSKAAVEKAVAAITGKTPGAGVEEIIKQALKQL